MRIIETFYSIQGEGRHVGAPSVFLRTYGCNLTCPGFGCAPGEKANYPLVDANTLDDVPLYEYGCDSYPSWHPHYKHLAPDLAAGAIVDNILAQVPEHNMHGIHLVLTGGEPLILKHQKDWIHVLRPLIAKYHLRNITFETNGTRRIDPEFATFISSLASRSYDVRTTFSCSVKTSESGEPFQKRVVPEAMTDLILMTMKKTSNVDVTYKFVVDTKDDVNEAVEIADYIWTHVLSQMELHTSNKPDIYLMPVGGTWEPYSKNMKKVAELALKYGMYYSPRLQLDLFGNAWGT